MENEKFEIFVEDVGDASVGISPLTVLKAELDENMVEYLKENKILGQFEERLENLVKEFFEAETFYRTYDTQDIEDERKYYEELEKERAKKICAESKDKVKHTIGNGWKLEFECDRCRNRFWAEGGIAQVDCPVCSPKHLANHPIITGKSEKIKGGK